MTYALALVYARVQQSTLTDSPTPHALSAMRGFVFSDLPDHRKLTYRPMSHHTCALSPAAPLAASPSDHIGQSSGSDRRDASAAGAERYVERRNLRAVTDMTRPSPVAAIGDLL